MLIKTKATTFGAEGGSCGNEVYYEGWGAYDGLSKFNASCQDHNCSNLDESKNYDPSVMVYNRSMATENNLKATYGVNGDNVYRVTCNRFAKLVDNDGNNMAWTGRLSRNTLFTTTTPSYFFNFNATPSYSYAPASKTATAPVSCDDSTTCPSNQVCSGYLASCDNDPSYSGQPPSCSVGTRADCDLITGCLWNVYSMGTCTETVSVNPYGIYFYGRNREDVPFGAAVIPSSYDLTNSARIPLRNQYSQINNETILAGRPYGCSTNASGNFSDGCKNIGQCSLNPNVFCFYGGANFSDFNKLSCSSGGDGECVPLWNTENIRIPKRSDNNNIFNKLFIKDYADYSYSNGYLTTGVLSDWANKGRSDITTIHCPDNVRSDDPVNSFCTVFPDLGNIQLKLDGNVIPVVNNEAVLTKGGLYELDFNSFIDPEQQPLKQIVINWGDSIQVITNVDNKPNAGAPHQFYHYFTGANKHVEIKIFDNWGAWTCVATSNGKWSVDACTKI